MIKSTRRAPLSAANSEKILSSARDLFGTYGFEGVDIRVIARNVGFTTGAVYQRFSGKVELFEAAFPEDHTRRRLAEAICRSLGGDWSGDLRDRYFGYADRILEDHG